MPQHEQRHHYRLAARAAEVSHHFRRLPPRMGIRATAALHHLGDGDVEREPAGLAAQASPAWPESSLRSVYLAATVTGVTYTIYSEWLNTTVRQSWAYSEWMPVLPVTGTGLSPLLQWIVVPTLALWFAVGRRPWGGLRADLGGERQCRN